MRPVAQCLSCKGFTLATQLPLRNSFLALVGFVLISVLSTAKFRFATAAFRYRKRFPAETRAALCFDLIRSRKPFYFDSHSVEFLLSEFEFSQKARFSAFRFDLFDLDLRPNFDFISLRSKVGRYVGSHIEPLARWSNGGSSRFEARAVEPRVRYAHVPLARGPVWGFSQAEAERLDLHVTLQHATRRAISSAPVSLDTPVEGRNRCCCHGKWRCWRPTL